MVGGILAAIGLLHVLNILIPPLLKELGQLIRTLSP
jgi:hypothetical protein